MIKEERLYGCFPFFQGLVTLEEICQCATSLREKRSSRCAGLLNVLPSAWDVSSETKQAIGRLLLERAAFLADNIEAMAREESRLSKEEDQ